MGGQLGRHAAIQPQFLGPGPQVARRTALGYMHRFVVQHPGEVDGALTQHTRINAQGAANVVPFGGGTLLTRWFDAEPYPGRLQAGQQAADGLLFRFVGGG